MKDKVIEIIKVGLQHSIAQAFLIFSGLLVVISMLWMREYIGITFFTLFYALIAHYLTALRRHESLGEYAVGKNRGQIILFTLVNIFLFVWWSTGIWSMLFNFGTIKFCSPLSPDLPCVSFYAMTITLVLLAIWIGIFFYKIFSKEKNLTTNDDSSKTVNDTRLIIGFILLVGFFALLLFSIIFIKQIVYYEIADFNDGWKIFGRIFFVFTFFIFGISMRAFRLYSIGKKQKLEIPNPWAIYSFQYVLFLGIIGATLIFSGVSAIEPINSTWVFYLMSASLTIISGFKGYGALSDKFV